MNDKETAVPGFEPTDPWKSEDVIVRRRNLPHFEIEGATYFVTFRCKTGTELQPAAKDIVLQNIRASDGDSIDLDAAVVMSDHVHAIFRLIGSHGLSGVLQSIKGRSSRLINKQLGIEGSVWMDESFDRIIRKTEDLKAKLEYLRDNPVKKGLASEPSKYKWLFVRSYE